MTKWITYRTDGGERVGVVDSGTVYGLGEGETLLGLLERGAELPRLAREALDGSETTPLEAVSVAPLLSPPLLVDGMCFWEHLRHCYAEWDPRHEKWPFFYYGHARTIVGANDPVRMFTETARFDYELEIGAVIGKEGENLTPEEAEEAIVGYTILGDWSARDIQMDRIVPLKGKDGATTLGPVLVTKDEFEERRAGASFDVRMDVWLNGEQVSSGNWSTMNWSFGDLISYVSRGSRVVPGEVIGSGTVGWGCLLEFERAAPERFPGWLEPGDRVAMEVEGIGRTDQLVTEALPLHPLSSGW